MNVWDIPDYFRDKEAHDDVVRFRRFQRLGWPLGPWGQNPAPYVDLIETLMAVDEIYHPRVTL